jgi:hypothetical protein
MAQAPGWGGLCAKPGGSSELAEYTSSAYILHKKPFVNALLILTIISLALALQAGVEQRSTITLVLRILAAGGSLGAYLLVRSGLKHRPASIVFLSLFACYVFVAHLAQRLDMIREELHDLTALNLIAYALMVPLFPLRVVGGAMGALLCLQMFILIAEGGRVMLGRELIKGIGLNAIGAAFALLAERLHRANFTLSRKFKEETAPHKAASAGVQRLLMNTLPAPVVREIAAGTRTFASSLKSLPPPSPLSMIDLPE